MVSAASDSDDDIQVHLHNIIAYGTPLAPTGQQELDSMVARAANAVKAAPHRKEEALQNAHTLAAAISIQRSGAPLDAAGINSIKLRVCPLFPFC